MIAAVAVVFVVAVVIIVIMVVTAYIEAAIAVVAAAWLIVVTATNGLNACSGTARSTDIVIATAAVLATVDADAIATIAMLLGVQLEI